MHILLEREKRSVVVRDQPVALLINPPIYDFALFDLFHKPYGLLRIGAWLAAAGYQIEFIDSLDYRDPLSTSILGYPKRKSNGTGKFHRQAAPFSGFMEISHHRFARYGAVAESLERRIAAVHPNIVLVSSGMTYWYPGVVEVVGLIRKNHPKIPIIVGGIYASLLPEHCARITGADYVIQGNAWPELSGILAHLNVPVPDDQPGSDVLLLPGVWRDAGVIRLNDGCPLRCRYCASHLICAQFSAGSAESTFGILSSMAEVCGIRNFAFYDDALLYEKERGFKPLLELIVESHMRINLYVPNALHVRYLDRETARLMKMAGFREVRLGFESSSDIFHDCYDNKVVREELLRALDILRDGGFKGEDIIVYILAGLPGQRAEEVEESVRFVAASSACASIAEYSPVPGTALWNSSVELSKYPIAEEPLYQNNSIHAMEWHRFSYDDMARLKALSRALSPYRYD